MPQMRPALLLLTLILASGCSNKTSDRNLLLLDVPDAIELSNKGSTLFIDPRSPEEFAIAHLPNAINMPFASGFERAAAENIHPSNVVIVYATSVQDVLGVAASKRLMKLGYADIYTLRGGLRQWIRAGKPVEGVDPDSIEPPTPSLENLN